MIYSVDIRESDSSVAEKFIAIIWEQETEDSPRSVFDIAVGDDSTLLWYWAGDTLADV
jgi:hypothetical protein